MTRIRSARSVRRRTLLCSIALWGTLGCGAARTEELQTEIIPLGPSKESGGCPDDLEAGVHYSSTRTVEQRIPRRWVETIEVRASYAKVRVVFVDEKDIVLLTTGSFSIQGYHGSCEAAGVAPVSPGSLAVRATMEGYRLVLETPRTVYLHHSTGIDEIELRVPRRIKVFIDGEIRSPERKKGRGMLGASM